MNQPRQRSANGRFLKEPAAEQEQVRRDYEANRLPLPDVALKHGISLSAIHRMVVQNGWRPRAPHRIDPSDLIMRMFAALEMQMRELETMEMKTQGAQAGVLAKLVSTLDKLIEIKDAEAGKRRSSTRSSKVIDELRAKLADRLAEFNQP